MADDFHPRSSMVAEGASSETTPLLRTLQGSGNGDHASKPGQIGHTNGSPRSPKSPSPPPSPTKDEEKPFPYWQIIILCYASVVEPVAFFMIFPYINEMVERIGHQLPENVGFWTGTIESLFSLVQMLLIIFYGRIADRLGRKPVLVFSLAGIAAASALFGMSATLWQMILFRCLAGLFAGSSVTIRAMLSENCTKSTQAKAFGWFMFARNLGIFIGPAIGESTAHLMVNIFPALTIPRRSSCRPCWAVRCFQGYHFLPKLPICFAGLRFRRVLSQYSNRELHLLR